MYLTSIEINRTNKYGNPLWMEAIVTEDADLVRLTLENGGDFNQRDAKDCSLF